MSIKMAKRFLLTGLALSASLSMYPSDGGEKFLDFAKSVETILCDDSGRGAEVLVELSNIDSGDGVKRDDRMSREGRGDRMSRDYTDDRDSRDGFCVLEIGENEGSQIDGNIEHNTVCFGIARCNLWGAFQCLLTWGGHVNVCGYGYPVATYGFNRTLIAFRLINMNAVDERGRTHLMVAALCNDIAMVQALIAAGAPIDLVDTSGRTALMKAACKGHTEIVQLFLVAGAETEVADQYSQTALSLAMMNGKIAIIDALIGGGALTNDVNEYGHLVLMKAISEGYTATVKVLIHGGVSPNIVDERGQTALMEAIEYGDIAMVRALIHARADVGAADQDGITALSKAISKNNISAIKALKAARVQHNGDTSYEGIGCAKLEGQQWGARSLKAGKQKWETVLEEDIPGPSPKLSSVLRGKNDEGLCEKSGELR